MAFDINHFAEEWKEQHKPPVPVNPVNLGEYIDKHYASQPFRALAKRSRDKYRIGLEYLRDCFGPKANIDLVVFNFEKLIPYLEKRRMAASSVHDYLTVVKVFLRTLGFEIKFSYRIPREERKAKKLRRQKRWFSDEDVEKCLAYQFLWDEDALIYRITIRMLIETGVRISELMSIRWRDVNIKEGTVLITESKTEPRPVFFSPETGRMLEVWGKSHSFQDAARIFPPPQKTVGVISQMLFDIGIKEVGDYRAAHTFRHYCATKLYYDGNMRIEDIAFLLGDEPATIVNNYIHPTPRMLRNRVSKACGWGYEKRPEDLPLVQDAISGLVNLGFAKPAARTAVLRIHKQDTEIGMEDLITKAVKAMKEAM